jgi:exodeoxyribonuclease VII small subunit
MTAPDSLSYDQAIAEVESLLEEIDDASLPIDELAPRIERAAGLLARCRRLLVRTEMRVTEALEALSDDDGDNGEGS